MDNAAQASYEGAASASALANNTLQGLVVRAPALTTYYFQGHYVRVAALSLSLYDLVSMLPHEIKYMWKSSSRKSRLTYMTLRYWTILYLLQGILVQFLLPSDSLTSCKVWASLDLWLAVPSAIAFFQISSRRLYAAFNCNTNVGRALKLLLSVPGVVSLTKSQYTIAKSEAVHLPPGFSGCFIKTTLSYTEMIWLPIGIPEATLLCFLFAKTCHIWSRGRKPPDILVIILRDTAMYLALCVTFLVSVALKGNFVVDSAIMLPGLATLFQAMGCRMLLNIHKQLGKTRMEAQHPPNAISLLIFRSSGESAV